MIKKKENTNETNDVKIINHVKDFSKNGANQTQIIAKLGVQPVIDPEKEIRTRVDFLKNYLKNSPAKGFVLGISGGQDSTLAGKLAQLAIDELKEEGEAVSFVAVRLPNGVQLDESDARLALEFIQPDETLTFNIQYPVEAFTDAFATDIQTPLSDFHKGNVKARMRMVTQYAVAGEKNLLVIGTDHAAEAVTGFFTKFGDGGADILPLSGLTKRQGKSLLLALEAPNVLYEKQPTADLLDHKPAQTDETELGITYDEIDDYLEGKAVSAKAKNVIEARYTATIHKRELPVTPFDV